MFACWQGHLSVVECLTTHGANVHHANNNVSEFDDCERRILFDDDMMVSCWIQGDTPLMWASFNHMRVVEYLLSHGANIDQRNNDVSKHRLPFYQSTSFLIATCVHNHVCRDTQL
jgi:Ankyrin repeat